MMNFSYATPETDFKNFVGRDEELNILKQHLIDKNNQLAIVTGQRAVGKTSFWNVFYSINKAFFNNSLYRFDFYLDDFQNEFNFEKITSNTLIVFEEVENIQSEKKKAFINSILARYPKNKFIIVCNSIDDKIKHINNKELTIKLKNLDFANTFDLLNRIVDNPKISNDLSKIVTLLNGNPYLIRYVGNLMKEKVMSFDELNRLIFQKYNQFGIVAPDGKPILTSSPQFVKLSNDIQIVNRNILDYKNFTQKDLYNLTPRQFEEFVAELLSKLGYSVDLTQATRDGGKDILVANHNEIGNFLYYIECKKYEPTKPIGVRLVRELYGTISVEKVTAGMIVTSSYFSPDAIEFTEKIKHQMKLVDYIEMKKWIDKKLISC